ncbi:MAG: hypothetical protein IPK50_20095 [Fibrobacterota bacterium]|nr:hypothetical protein [Fibrobacterota bacterium]QQS04559.1 MAG: hypothetical protein IPK50_20095 [Fibrobacterota bacterium]
MTKLDKIHLAWGLLFVGVFLWSGTHMKAGFPELYHGDDTVRMLYRSAHIYILFSALLNLALAGSGDDLSRGVRGWIQGISSLALMGASVLILVEFLKVSQQVELHRPLVFWGVVLSLVATVFKLGARLVTPRAVRR